jgi:Spy/CpxP family protein refolding chaperone
MNTGKFSTIMAVFCFITIFLASSYAAAQPDGKMMKAGKMKKSDPGLFMSGLKDRLKLTEQQESQIRPIIEDHLKKRDDVVQKHREKIQQERQAMKDALLQSRTDVEKQLEPILTKEQIDEFRKFQDERGRKLREKRTDRKAD